MVGKCMYIFLDLNCKSLLQFKAVLSFPNLRQHAGQEEDATVMEISKKQNHDWHARKQ